MTDTTLTAPVADAFSAALADGIAVVDQIDPAAVLADYRARYVAAEAAHEVTVNVLRLHRRRGAFIAREYVTEGTTYADRLAEFGIVQENGKPLANDKAQHRDASVFAVIATLRPTLWDVDTLADLADADAFSLWAKVSDAARAGAAREGKNGEPSTLAKAAAGALKAVSGHAGSVQPEGTAHYADVFSAEAWPAVVAEFRARLALISESLSAVKAARDANKAQVQDARREADAAIAAATGAGAASVRTAEDVSSSEGSTRDSQGADNGEVSEPEPLDVAGALSALRTHLSLLTGGGANPLPKSVRDDFYAVVREFTLSK